MKTLHLLFITITSLISIAGCNPDEAEPAYLIINHVTVSSNPTTQGSNCSNVKDVWVYVDNQYVGTYQLPARIPVLENGSKNVILRAGILENGIAATHNAYPLYNADSRTVTFVPGQETTIDTFHVAYFPALNFTWYEDFEKDAVGGGFSLAPEPSTNLAPLATDSIDVFEGVRCLKMQVDGTNHISDIETNGDGYVLYRGKDIYLEMNYRCDHEFTVGLRGMLATDKRNIPVLLFNPSPNWKKTYINLSKFVNSNFDVPKFKVYFYLSTPPGGAMATVYLDNLKLISN
ncbi:MAG: hypothetical protein ACKOX3_11335 [Bacteroidota bacterium]